MKPVAAQAASPVAVERRQAPAHAAHRERRQAVRRAGAAARAAAGPTRALIVCGAAEGEPLGRLALRVLEGEGTACALLDPGRPGAQAELREQAAAAHGVLLFAAGAEEPWLEHLAGAEPAGRAYGLVLLGRTDGGVRRRLCDRLDAMGLIDACAQAQFDRFTGYHEPPPGMPDPQEPLRCAEVRGVARAMTHVMAEIRAGRLDAPDLLLARPHPPALAGTGRLRSGA